MLLTQRYNKRNDKNHVTTITSYAIQNDFITCVIKLSMFITLMNFDM